MLVFFKRSPWRTILYVCNCTVVVFTVCLLLCCRRLIWEDNVNYIQKHNLAADRGEHTYWLGQNEYADMVGGFYTCQSKRVNYHRL